MNENQVRRILRKAVTAAGSEAAYARRIGVTQQLVNAVLLGKQPPRGKILAELGLERVISYRVKELDLSSQENRR